MKPEIFKEALETAFDLIRFVNKYYDKNEPWKTRTSDPQLYVDTLFNCVQLISNVAVLLYPFLPFSSEKIFAWLNLKSEWKPQFVSFDYNLPKTNILFERLG